MSIYASPLKHLSPLFKESLLPIFCQIAQDVLCPFQKDCFIHCKFQVFRNSSSNKGTEGMQRGKEWIFSWKCLQLYDERNYGN